MKNSIALVAIAITVACASNEKKIVMAPAADVKTESPIPAAPATPTVEAKPKNETPKIASSAKNPEWKGECRKVDNEGGIEVKNSSYKRLQSSYVFDGVKVIWFIKSFSDVKCQTLFGGNSSTFSCDVSPLKKTATCKQISQATWTNNAWKNERMVDYAGYPNELTVVYQAVSKNEKTIFLSSTNITDGGELETEILTNPK